MFVSWENKKTPCVGAEKPIAVQPIFELCWGTSASGANSIWEHHPQEWIETSFRLNPFLPIDDSSSFSYNLL